MNDDFELDLEDGKVGERAVRHFVESVWGKQFISFNDDSAYDVLFQNDFESPITVEVKTDYWEQEMDQGGSGNMAIEYKCRGRRSGIRKTKAQFFAYYFPNLSDEHLWIISVKKLKELLRENGFKAVDGGETYDGSDKKVTRCYLIPRFEHKEHFSRYTFDGRGGWHVSLES